MREKFINWSPRKSTQDLLDVVDVVIEQNAGYEITLRSLYYQLLDFGVYDNTLNSYKRLISIMTKARNAGLIDWEIINDRRREFVHRYIFESNVVALQRCWEDIEFSIWDRQDNYVEVWAEKDAVAGVLKVACDRLRVPWMACIGNLSSTMAYQGGKRFYDAHQRGKRCFMLHLGDHDPNGIDMTRDNEERLQLYSDQTPIEVRRIALNMDQVEEFNLRPSIEPAKKTDSRYKSYVSRFETDNYWELDAIKPKALDRIITEEIEELTDMSRMYETLQLERDAIEPLQWIGENAQDYIDQANEERE